ncbi:2Fe-2S iron-sulfur cluster binding domain-containing protein [Paenibacillus sp. HN-1]|uniref:2Fe-2S iron-sulfur cluster-binding protein n=1 Tax=Paenibacillus TaxID=44249 RepID=UPI001CA9137E|nr:MULTISPECIES: 2Fe-2S iron-sulfur cluster-binding protein [Paenibacillus]MBY9081641.1 2Fe-2S iron-sulfur cluster binding domain-containing protein [Paenibacillus sp. CGMCC 1.18879]MBY9083510.1 2Fe-2S iron-sulfur cluster binding domain-containing protein [Paenibacillus sinensis]
MKPQHVYPITFLPSGKSANVPKGITLLDAARRAGIHIATRCGGKAGCLMCKVHIEDGSASSLSPPGEVERRKLGGLPDEGIRLACQAKIAGEAVVSVPEDPLKAAIRKRLAEAERGGEDSLW